MIGDVHIHIPLIRPPHDGDSSSRSAVAVHAARQQGAVSMLNLFQQPKKAPAPKVKAAPVVIAPDYRVAAGFFLGAFSHPYISKYVRSIDRIDRSINQ